MKKGNVILGFLATHINVKHSEQYFPQLKEVISKYEMYYEQNKNVITSVIYVYSNLYWKMKVQHIGCVDTISLEET